MILGAKSVGDIGNRKFATGGLRDRLNDLVKGDLHSSRQVKGKRLLDNVGDTAGAEVSMRIHAGPPFDLPSLSRLRVDSNDSLVRAADIRRVDRKIWKLPSDIATLCSLVERLEALLDSILMRTGERREHEFTSIRVSWMNGKTGAFCDGIADGEDVGKVKEGGDSLRVEVESERDDVHVSGTFSVTKYRSLYSVSTGENTQFRGRDSTACVIKSG